MITINLASGQRSIFYRNEYDDYKYDDKTITIIKDSQYIAIFNMKYVASFVIEK